MAKKETTLYSNNLRISKEKQQAFWKSTAQCIGPVLLIGVIVSLLAILIIGNPEGFVRSFNATYVGQTVGIIVASVLLFCVLYLGIYFLRYKQKAIFREFSLVLFTVTLSYIVTLITE